MRAGRLELPGSVGCRLAPDHGATVLLNPDRHHGIDRAAGRHAQPAVAAVADQVQTRQSMWRSAQRQRQYPENFSLQYQWQRLMVVATYPNVRLLNRTPGTRIPANPAINWQHPLARGLIGCW